MVGMSYAYALLNQSACDELVLIDVDKKRAVGEAMDLNHGLAFSGSNMKIFAGDYEDCGDADIVVICAGVPQKPGETRLDLLRHNAQVFQSLSLIHIYEEKSTERSFYRWQILLEALPAMCRARENWEICAHMPSVWARHSLCW